MVKCRIFVDPKNLCIKSEQGMVGTVMFPLVHSRSQMVPSLSIWIPDSFPPWKVNRKKHPLPIFEQTSVGTPPENKKITFSQVAKKMEREGTQKALCSKRFICKIVQRQGRSQEGGGPWRRKSENCPKIARSRYFSQILVR